MRREMWRYRWRMSQGSDMTRKPDVLTLLNSRGKSVKRSQKLGCLVSTMYPSKTSRSANAVNGPSTKLLPMEHRFSDHVLIHRTHEENSSRYPMKHTLHAYPHFRKG